MEGKRKTVVVCGGGTRGDQQPVAMTGVELKKNGFFFLSFSLLSFLSLSPLFLFLFLFYFFFFFGIIFQVIMLCCVVELNQKDGQIVSVLNFLSCQA